MAGLENGNITFADELDFEIEELELIYIRCFKDQPT